jgi:hypothetical protein
VIAAFKRDSWRMVEHGSFLRHPPDTLRSELLNAGASLDLVMLAAHYSAQLEHPDERQWRSIVKSIVSGRFCGEAT